MYLPRRFLHGALAQLAITVCYLLRIVLSIAVVPIADERKWDETTQGLVLSAFFWGYIATQILGGWLSQKFGFKRVMGIGIALASVSTFALPFTVFSPYVVVVARILCGLVEGITFPAAYEMIGKWFPKTETSFAAAFVNTGAPLGTVFAMGAGGAIASQFGWPWAFYFSGFVGLLWLIPFVLLASDSPNSSNHFNFLPISESERTMINSNREESKPRQVQRYQQMGAASNMLVVDDDDLVDEVELEDFSVEAIETKKKKSESEQKLAEDPSESPLKSAKRATKGALETLVTDEDIMRLKNIAEATPWKRLLSHPAVLVLAFNHFAYNWGFYVFLSWLPTYFKRELSFDLKQSGLIAFLPYLVLPVMSTIGGLLVDFFSRREIATRLTMRKIFEALALGLPALCLYALSYHKFSVYPTVALLTMAIGFGGFVGGGYQGNHVDLSPKYAGLLWGITNTVGQLPGMFGVLLTGPIIKAMPSDGWGLVFLMTATLNNFAALIYIMFAKAEFIDFDAQEHEDPVEYTHNEHLTLDH